MAGFDFGSASAGAGLGGSIFGPVGAAIGGLAGGIFGKKRRGPQTTVAVDPQTQGIRNDVWGRARRVANQTPTEFTHNAWTRPFSQTQVAGQNAMHGVMNSPLIGSQNNVLGQFMSGARDGTAAANAEMPLARSLLQYGARDGQAARHHLLGQNNPALQEVIDAAQQDLARNYRNVVAPSFMGGSSFGNAGLAFAENDARNDLARNMGRIGSDLRFLDHKLQAELGLDDVQRQDLMFQDNAKRQLQAGQTTGILGENAAGRADEMFAGNQQRALIGTELSQAGLRDAMARAGQLFDMGTQFHNQNANAATNQYAEHQRLQNWDLERLGAFNPLLGVAPGQTRTEIPGVNPVSDIFGGAIAGIQAGKRITDIFGGGANPRLRGAMPLSPGVNIFGDPSMINRGQAGWHLTPGL